MTAILESGGSWRVGDGLVALLFGAVTALFAVTRTRWHLAPPSHAAPRPPVAASGETLRLPAVWLGIGFFLLYTGMEVSAGQWSYSLLTESRHLPGEIAGYWVGAYWGSFTAGRILFGLTPDRVSPVALIRPCLAGMAAGAVLFGVTGLGRGAGIGLILFGVSLAPLFALMMVRTQEQLGPAHAPNAIGFQVAAAGIGAGTLPSLAGVLAKLFGLEILPGFLLMATVLMFLLFEGIQRLGVKRTGRVQQAVNDPSVPGTGEKP
jgi:fucose permease